MTRASELDDINRNYPIRRQREKNGKKRASGICGSISEYLIHV